MPECPPLRPPQRKPDCLAPLFPALERKMYPCLRATAAAHNKLPGNREVEVEHPAALDDRAVHLTCTDQPNLFIDRKDDLERRMWKIFILNHGKADGYAGTIIGTEGCSIRMEPPILFDELDGIACKVMHASRDLLADHIEMGLQGERRLALASRRGCLADDKIAISVSIHCQRVGTGPLRHFRAHARCILCPPWNRGDPSGPGERPLIYGWSLNHAAPA